MQEHEQQQVFVEWVRSQEGLFFKVVRAYASTAHDQEDLFQEIATQVAFDPGLSRRLGCHDVDLSRSLAAITLNGTMIEYTVPAR